MSKRKEKRHHGIRNFIIYCLILVAIWYAGTFTLKTTEVTVESKMCIRDRMRPRMATFAPRNDSRQNPISPRPDPMV